MENGYFFASFKENLKLIEITIFIFDILYLLFFKIYMLEVVMGKRNHYRWLLCLTLLLVVVSLSACSTHEKTTKQSNTKTEQTKSKSKNKAKTKAKSKKTIATELKNSSKKQLVYSPLGDSISVGLMSNSVHDRFSSQFARTLAKETGKKVTEEGAAETGKTATNFGLPNVQTIIDQKPDLVTVEFGTNDGADVNNPQALPDYQNSIDQILTQLQSQTKAKIILITSWSAPDGPYAQNYLRFDKALTALGKKHNVPVVNLESIWQRNPSFTGAPASITEPVWGKPADKMHPNQKGHDAIAKALTKTINEPIDK